MVFITEPLKMSEISEFKFKKEYIRYYEEYKENFTDEAFIDLLIDELKECVKKDPQEKTKIEKDIIELILYLIRNSLSFEKFNENESQKQILIKIFSLYLKDVGVFNALIFLSQEFDKENKHLCYLFLEIFHQITKRIDIVQIFGSIDEKNVFAQL